MKNNILHALLTISISCPARNTTAANTLITQVCVEFQGKKLAPEKNLCFRSVIKSKSMGMQVSMNEEVADLLLLESETDSVISSAET